MKENLSGVGIQERTEDRRPDLGSRNDVAYLSRSTLVSGKIMGICQGIVDRELARMRLLASWPMEYGSALQCNNATLHDRSQDVSTAVDVHQGC